MKMNKNLKKGTKNKLIKFAGKSEIFNTLCRKSKPT